MFVINLGATLENQSQPGQIFMLRYHPKKLLYASIVSVRASDETINKWNEEMYSEKSNLNIERFVGSSKACAKIVMDDTFRLFHLANFI